MIRQYNIDKKYINKILRTFWEDKCNVISNMKSKQGTHKLDNQQFQALPFRDFIKQIFGTDLQCRYGILAFSN